MAALDWLDDALARLDEQGLLRRRAEPIAAPGPHVVRGGRRLLNLCSNDYLGLAGRAARGETGSGASRLVVGDTRAHVELERALAAWLGVEDCLLFSSGYAANVGAIAALGGPNALIVSDALNHASLIDGCRLSRSRVVVVPHGDVAAVEMALSRATERRRLVVTDGYFSMDGTRARVAELATVAARYGAALYVDEAHGFGVWGPEGRGVCGAAGVVPDVWVGTLGKSFGTSGAFVAGSRALTQWMWNAARSFVFSTGLPPACALAALDALPLIRSGEFTRTLHANANALRAELGEIAGPSEGPIVPVVLGDSRLAVSAASALLEAGVFAQAIRPPTVPSGTARLRMTVQAGHREDEVRAAGRAVRDVVFHVTRSGPKG